MTVNKKSIKKILLFKVGAIGDVIMTTPLVRQIRNNFPDARIDYLVGKTSSEVLNKNKNIDEIITFDEGIFFKKKAFSLINLIKLVKRRKYDTVFVLDKHWIFNLVASFFGIPSRIGFDRLGKEGLFLTKKAFFDGSQHEILYYLDLCMAAGMHINKKDIIPDIFTSKKDADFADSVFKKHGLNKNSVCIAAGGAKNPGQSVSLKLWPRENFASLISELVKKTKVILVGDKDDVETSQWIVKKTKSKDVIDLTGKTTIHKTASIMRKCRAVICNDTGPMHMASAVNKRIISIFGPTDPKRFAPLHKESIFLWKAKKACNDVYGSFKSCKGNNYTEKISVEDVLMAYEKIAK
jgi:lipopolysaccharide heptosyltransferase II